MLSITFSREAWSRADVQPAARNLHRLVIALVATLAACLLAAGGAQAAVTVGYDPANGGTMTVSGTAADESLLLEHQVDIWGVEPPDPNFVVVKGTGDTELVSGTHAGACEEDLGNWKCTRPARVIVDLGAGDDGLKVIESTLPFTVPIEVQAGPGNDSIGGGSANDILRGGDGDDLMSGGPGDDRIYGEAGNDRLAGDASLSAPGGNDHLEGGPGDDIFEEYTENLDTASLAGSDTYVGGTGYDSFSYFFGEGPVSITLDGLANDGKAGEADNIHPDVEKVGGSSGNDTIVGSNGPNYLWGGGGDDVIRGLGGNDELWGNNGDDRIEGGPGNDELIGGCMADVLIGGPGADTMSSDDSSCSPLQRSQFDRIEANDGERDALVFCQQDGDPAGDTAIVDAIDPVVRSGPGACAKVSVVAAPGPGVKAPVLPKDRLRARLGKTVALWTGAGRKGRAAKMAINLKRRRLILGTLRAKRKTRVVTTVTLRQKKRMVTVGRGAVTATPKKPRTLQVRLSKGGVRVLKKMRKARVAVRFKVGKKIYRKAFVIAVAGKARR